MTRTPTSTFCLRVISVLSLGLTLAFGQATAQTGTAVVKGAGSSMVRELMRSWSEQYGGVAGGVVYDSTGSSVGVARASEHSVDFGVSDVPLTSSALKLAGLQQMPLAGAAVAVIVNLPELQGKPIKLNGDILADIYDGHITRWNHAQIAGSNPGMALPDKPIVPVWRADGSGQSYVFSTYLARGNSRFRRTTGATNTLKFAQGMGVKGGQEMIDTLKKTPGSVGYESLGSAQKAQLPAAQLLNSAGQSVAPTAASIGEALERAVWSKDANSADLDGSAGAGSYPMVAVAYALISAPAKTPSPSGDKAVKFLQLAVAQGDAQAKQAGFLPLPLVAKSLTAAPR